MSDFLMCFNLNIISRYFLGYFIGGTVSYLYFYGYSFWVLFMTIVGFGLAVLDTISFFLLELEGDNNKYDSEKQQIIKEKAEQGKIDNEL